jgi:hypothetical protein
LIPNCIKATLLGNPNTASKKTINTPVVEGKSKLT